MRNLAASLVKSHYQCSDSRPARAMETLKMIESRIYKCLMCEGILEYE